MTSSKYEIVTKGIIELAIFRNSLKYLNHIWNVNNVITSREKKTKTKNKTAKELKHGKGKRKSLLELEKNSYGSNTGTKIIDLIQLLISFNQRKNSTNSIR